MTSVQTIGVIGAGTMGGGIAQACAVVGLSVMMIDVDEAAVACGRNAVSSSLDRLVKKDKLAAADKESAMNRIDGTTDYDVLGKCDLVIEAATENEALKVKILKKIDEFAKTETIVATNTSSISITKLAATTKRPQRFIGMHFFNPVPMMALVELIRGLQTGRDRGGRQRPGEASRQDSYRREEFSGVRREPAAMPDAQRGSFPVCGRGRERAGDR